MAGMLKTMRLVLVVGLSFLAAQLAAQDLTSNSLWAGTAMLPGNINSPAILEFFPNQEYYFQQLIPGTNVTIMTKSYQIPEQASFILRPSANPKQIDLSLLFFENIQLVGIYSIQGKSLSIMAHPSVRPTTFTYCVNCTQFTLTLQDSVGDSALVGSWLGQVTTGSSTSHQFVSFSLPRTARGILDASDAFFFTAKAASGPSDISFIYRSTNFGQLSLGLYSISGPALTLVVAAPSSETRPSSLVSACSGCTTYALYRQDTLIDTSFFGSWTGTLQRENTIETIKIYFFLENNLTRCSFPLGNYDVLFVSSLQHISFISSSSKMLLGLYNKTTSGQLSIVLRDSQYPRPTEITNCTNCEFYNLVQQDQAGDTILEGAWGSFKPHIVFTFFGDAGSKKVDGASTTFVWSTNSASNIVTILYLDNLQTAFAHYSVQGNTLTLIENLRNDPTIPTANGCATCTTFVLQRCPSAENCPSQASKLLIPSTLLFLFVVTRLAFIFF